MRDTGNSSTDEKGEGRDTAWKKDRLDAGKDLISLSVQLLELATDTIHESALSRSQAAGRMRSLEEKLRFLRYHITLSPGEGS